MKWASKAKLEIYGDVDALSRIEAIAVAMSEHGLTGHGFSVEACDGKTIEKNLGYWDGHGSTSLHRLKLTELPTGNASEKILLRSVEPDSDEGNHFEWVEKKHPITPIQGKAK